MGVAAALLGFVGWGWAEDKPASSAAQPIVFELRVPADAIVVIEGEKTRTTGEIRQYQTPPVLPGKRYAYALKVSAKGKELTKELTLKHGVPNVLDLRPEFLQDKPAEAKPEDGKKPDGEKKPIEEKQPDGEGTPKN
jgi:uncharacterized protein (TIGR03000 family)